MGLVRGLGGGSAAAAIGLAFFLYTPGDGWVVFFGGCVFP